MIDGRRYPAHRLAWLYAHMSLLLLALLMPAVVWAQTSPSDQPVDGKTQESGDPNTNKPKAEADSRGTKQVPFVVEIVRTDAEREEERRKDAAEKSRRAEENQLVKATWFLVFATFVLAAFTALLYFSTRTIALDAKGASAAALRASTDATNLARAEFNATHRPEIMVHSFDVGFVEVTDQFVHGDNVTSDAVSARFAIVNKGVSDATILEIRAKVFMAKTLRLGEKMDAIDKHANAKLAAGAVLRDMEIPARAMDTAVSYFNAGLGKAPEDPKLWCIGFIAYADNQGRRRETGFCRSYDARDERWVKEPESDYEYAY